MDDDLDSDKRGAWESEEESEEEREELGVFTSHQESEGREEGSGWEEREERISWLVCRNKYTADWSRESVLSLSCKIYYLNFH